jgi:hypothetical protein
MLIPIPVAATASSPTCRRLRPEDDGACASSCVVVVDDGVVVEEDADGQCHDGGRLVVEDRSGRRNAHDPPSNERRKSREALYLNIAVV